MADRMPQEVLLNDGEGIHHGDINLLQRYMHSFFLDGYLAQLGRVAVSDLGALTTHCYAVGFSGAPYGHASTNRTSCNLGGLILQRLGSSQPSGDDPQFLAYYIDADEASFLHDTAAVNPRWDIITVQLAQVDDDAADNATRDYEDDATGVITSETFVKKRKVAATITLTKGTEAASPVEPATPAGHVKLAAFRVTVGMTTFNAKTDIRDYRMPLGFEEDFVPGVQWGYIGTQWSLAQGFGTIANVVGSVRNAYGFPRSVSRAKRVLGIGLSASSIVSTTHTFDLGRADLIAGSAGGTGFTVVENIPVNVGNSYRAQGWSTFTPALPLWSNGYAAGYAVIYESSATVALFVANVGPEVAAIRLASQSDQSITLSGARWYLAG
jgi:hypothetical protein